MRYLDGFLQSFLLINQKQKADNKNDETVKKWWILKIQSLKKQKDKNRKSSDLRKLSKICSSIRLKCSVFNGFKIVHGLLHHLFHLLLIKQSVPTGNFIVDIIAFLPDDFQSTFDTDSIQNIEEILLFNFFHWLLLLAVDLFNNLLDTAAAWFSRSWLWWLHVYLSLINFLL